MPAQEDLPAEGGGLADIGPYPYGHAANGFLIASEPYPFTFH